MATNDNILDDTILVLGKKKRRNRDAVTTTIVTPSIPTDETTDNTPAEQSDYTYDYLITRAFDTIHALHRDKVIGQEHSFVLQPPQLALLGTKRTSFLNFGSICKSLNRQEKQLFEYMVSELGTKASIDVHHSLIIRGRYRRTHIENVLRSFIKEYVICKTCHSPDTLLGKSQRLTMLKCTTCQSNYSVSSITTGFRAQTGKRSRAT